MSTSVPLRARRAAPLSRTQGRSKVMIVAGALFLVTSAVNLQMPLYTVYAGMDGHGTSVVTIVFSFYVTGLLPVLIFLGGISDRLGRRRAIFLALALAIGATLIVSLKPGLATLVIARILQGIAVGLCAGAGTAFLSELLPGPKAPERAAVYVAAMTSFGFGSGALFTGAALFFQETLTPISYFIHMFLSFSCLLALFLVPESRTHSLSPRMRLPHFPAGILFYGSAVAVAWAVAGMVIAVVPAELARHGLIAWSGLALFLVCGAGMLCQPLARKMGARQAVRLGLVLVPAGYALLAVGAWLGMVALVLVGSALAGAACYGFTYLGGLTGISAIAGTNRASAISGYFLFAYLGFSLPVALSGLIADALGLSTALLLFGIAVLIAHLALWFVEVPGWEERG